MKDIKKEIADLKARIQELKNQIESVRWQPVGGNWCIDDEGIIFEAPSTQGNKVFGHERPTEQQANRVVVEMRRFNRLLALRDELCGDDVVEQGTTDSKYVVYFNAVENHWNETRYNVNFVTPYFSTKEHAQRACNMLNSGEVEL